MVTAKRGNGTRAVDFVGFVEIQCSDEESPIHQLILDFNTSDQGVRVVEDIAFFNDIGSVTVTGTSIGPNPVSGSIQLNTTLERPQIKTLELLTNEDPLRVTGVSTPNSIVELVVNDQVVATVTSNNAGEFSVQYSFPDNTLGPQVVFVRGVDAAGTPQQSESATVTARPGILVDSSPFDGETDIAVTRETILYFSVPLDPTSVNENSIYARFGDQDLPLRRHVSRDKRTVTLFYNSPLPGSSTVRVYYDGTILKSDNGASIDGSGDGQPGGDDYFEFSTLSLNSIPGTSVCGRVFASELSPNPGGPSINTPLPGVLITVDGLEQTFRTTTDESGNFRLDPAPAGRFFVHIDGRTATLQVPQGAYYPFVGKAWESRAGKESNVGNVHLPLVQPGTLQDLNSGGETTITFSPSTLQAHPELAGVEIQVPEDSLYFDDGSLGTQVGIAPVSPDRLPGTLPQGLNFGLVITVQTNGATNFDVPVPVRFPNLEGLAPGEKTALWSFNHDSGKFEIVGSMTVTADGLFVVSDPGVGIRAPGWHGVQRGLTASGVAVNGALDPRLTDPSLGAEQEAAHGDGDSDAVCSTSNQVYLHNGEEVLTRTDLVIPGRGDIHFRFTRTYRSRIFYEGPMGHNWNHNYNERLSLRSNGDVVRFNGRTHRDLWVSNNDGTFVTPKGFFSTLIRHDTGEFTLREPNGFKRHYRNNGLLSRHEDRNGNQMLFLYDQFNRLSKVIDVYGRAIDFGYGDRVERERDPGSNAVVDETCVGTLQRIHGEIIPGPLSVIQDFTGRQIRFEYLPVNTNPAADVSYVLTHATSPVVESVFRRTEKYEYLLPSGNLPDNMFNLISVTSPEEFASGGPPSHVLTYGLDPNDPLTFDKVISETIGGTNASGVASGGTTYFQYEEINQTEPAGQFDLPRGKATITDPVGNVTEYFVNERNHHIISRRLTRGVRPNEPAFYETRSYFNNDGLLVRKVFPEGNELIKVYGTGSRVAEQNVVEIRRVAGPRGGGEDLVSRFSFEPLYNQIASTTDPRGNSPTYTPPLSSFNADRYTTFIYYDYQEGNQPIPDVAKFNLDISGAVRGLGDLNDDGLTDQVAGNMVQTRNPSVTLRPDSNEAQLLGSTQQEIVLQHQWNERGQPLARINEEGNVTSYEYYPENDPTGSGTENTDRIYTLLTNKPQGHLRSVISDARVSPRRATTTSPQAIFSTFEYDLVGNLVRKTDPRGIATEFTYNGVNEVTELVIGADVSVALATGQLLTGEAPFRYRSRTTYNSNGWVVKSETENRDGNFSEIGEFVEAFQVYDILGNVLESRIELNGSTFLTTTTRYDANQLPILVTKPEGNKVATTYDERNLVHTATIGFESPVAATASFDYDKNGNRVRATDAEDNDGDGSPETRILVHDGFDRIVEILDPLGNRSVNHYDIAGQITRIQVFGHPAGQPGAPNVKLRDVEMKYDELGRKYQTDDQLFVSPGTNPTRPVTLSDGNNDGVITSFTEFDRLSRITHVVEDDGQVTENRYDGLNRVTQTSDALGNRVVNTYDRNSNIVEVKSFEVSPEDIVPIETFSVVYVYDQLNRVVRITDNVGQTSRVSYDSRNNVVSSSDSEGPEVNDPLGLFPQSGQSGSINEAGNTKTYIHDGLNRKITEICDLRVGGVGGGSIDTSNSSNPDGLITMRFEYDGNSRMSAVIDDKNNRCDYFYDAIDRKVRELKADGTQSTIVYDKDNNAIQATDANGTVVTNSFDALNRLVRTDVARANGVLGTTLQLYEFDGLSRPTKTSNNNGSASTTETTTYVQDSLSRVVEESQNGKIVSDSYSGDGKLLQVVYPSGRTIDYSHDAIDRVKQVTESGNLIQENFYVGPGGRLLKRSLGNGTETSFLNEAGTLATGYDGVKRLTRLRHLGPNGTAFVDREYSYNRASMRTAEKRNDDSGLTDRFTYDSTYRIVQSRYDEDGSGGQARDTISHSYQLDGVGNRVSVANNSEENGVSNDAYTVNEMNEYLTINGTVRSYDANGNLTDDGTRLFAYDYLNRLVTVTDKVSGALIVEYRYDAESRRREKIIYDSTNSGVVLKTTRFHWYEWICIEEVNSAGEVEISFVNGGGLDNHCQFSRTAFHELGAGTFYTHQNARGDIVAVSEAAGVILEKFRYDDYGRPDKLSVTGNPHYFQGTRRDVETGLYYLRNRYYNPETGRFISRDPYLDSVNTGNLYSFVGNSPASRGDPTGEVFGSIIAGIMGRPDKNYCFLLGIATGIQQFIGESVAAVYKIWIDADLALQSAELSNMIRANSTGLPLDTITKLEQIRKGNIAAGMNHVGNLTAGVGTLYYENVVGGKIFGWGKGVARCRPHGKCFVAGTQVALIDGESRNIEEVEVGQRVLSKEADYPLAEPNINEDWRVLTAKVVNEGNPNKVSMVTLLRSPDWIKTNYDKEKTRVWLEISEMGVKGWGKVLSIEGPPKIESGPGRIVLTTFKHIADSVFQLRLEGMGAPLKPTGAHRFYSVDRQDWVETKDLRFGESIETQNGSTRVIGLRQEFGKQAVFNFEVQGTHTYYVASNVGSGFVWTHNGYSDADHPYLPNPLPAHKGRRQWISGANRGDGVVRLNFKKNDIHEQTTIVKNFLNNHPNVNLKKNSGSVDVSYSGGRIQLESFAFPDPGDGTPSIFDFSKGQINKNHSMTKADGDFYLGDYTLAHYNQWKDASGEIDVKRATAFRVDNALTWHHHENGTRLILVPGIVHNDLAHAGNKWVKPK